jgi:hypothetical protein
MASKLVDFKVKLKKIPSILLSIECCRGYQKGNNPLSTINSFSSSGRWHIKGRFGSIYAGESEIVCSKEILRQFEGITPKYGYKLSK